MDEHNGFSILGMCSDGGLALAYFVISTEILVIAGQAERIPDSLMHVLRLFEAFIFLCGSTHLIGVWAWVGFGHQVAHSFSKMLAALVSVYTAIVFPSIVIQALQLIFKDVANRVAYERSLEYSNEVGKKFRVIIQRIRESLKQRDILTAATTEMVSILHMECCGVFIKVARHTAPIIVQRLMVGALGGTVDSESFSRLTDKFVLLSLASFNAGTRHRANSGGSQHSSETRRRQTLLPPTGSGLPSGALSPSADVSNADVRSVSEGSRSSCTEGINSTTKALILLSRKSWDRIRSTSHAVELPPDECAFLDQQMHSIARGSPLTPQQLFVAAKALVHARVAVGEEDSKSDDTELGNVPRSPASNASATRLPKSRRHVGYIYCMRLPIPKEPSDSGESLPEEMEMEDGLMLFQVKAGENRARSRTQDVPASAPPSVPPIAEEPATVDSARLPLSPPFSNPLRRDTTSPMSDRSAHPLSPPPVPARSMQLRSRMDRTPPSPGDTALPLPFVVYDTAAIDVTADTNPIVISMPPPGPPHQIRDPDSARLSVHPPQTSASSILSRSTTTNWSIMDRPRTAFLPELREGPGSPSRPHSEDLHLLEDIRDQVGFALEQACAISQEKVHLRWAADTERHRREAGSAFLAMMSHEMRTPLHAILAYADLLANTKLDPEQRDFADSVQSSSKILKDLIDDVLDMSKLEVDQVELEVKPFSLGGCIEEVMSVVSGKISQQHVRLNLFVEDNVPDTLYGDVTRFRQVLLNLASNATKFCHEGEVLVRAALYDEEAWHAQQYMQQHAIALPTALGHATTDSTQLGISTGQLPLESSKWQLRFPEGTYFYYESPVTKQHAPLPMQSSHSAGDLEGSQLDFIKVVLLVEVHDTGIGIPAERAVRLFQKFSQIDASTARQYGGTGLGLPICQKLVALQGGSIWTVSSRGRGSCFAFTVSMNVSRKDWQASRRVSGSERLDRSLDRLQQFARQQLSSVVDLCNAPETSPSSPSSPREGRYAVVLDDWPSDNVWFCNALNRWRIKMAPAMSIKALMEFFGIPAAGPKALVNMQRMPYLGCSAIIIDMDSVIQGGRTSDLLVFPAWEIEGRVHAASRHFEKQESRASDGSYRNAAAMTPMHSKSTASPHFDSVGHSSPAAALPGQIPLLLQVAACIPVILLVSSRASLFAANISSDAFISVLTKPVKRRQLRVALAASAAALQRTKSQDNLLSVGVPSATVEVALPDNPASTPTVKTDLAEPERVASASAESQRAYSQKLKDLRVLMVEDNMVNQRLGLRLLSRIGVSSSTAGNGLEALEQIRDSPPFNVVLLDLDMPVMGGLQCSTTIRATVPENKQPWIVAMTASVFTEDRQQCKDAGMDDFLPKPFVENDLREVLSKYVQRREMQQEHFPSSASVAATPSHR